MANLVVALPEAVGTRSVEILQSYTRGSRAPRLAKVRPPIHALFSIHNHTAKNYLSLRMISRAVINFVSVILRHIFHPIDSLRMHVSSLPKCQATAYYVHLFNFPKRN